MKFLVFIFILMTVGARAEVLLRPMPGTNVSFKSGICLRAMDGATQRFFNKKILPQPNIHVVDPADFSGAGTAEYIGREVSLTILTDIPLRKRTDRSGFLVSVRRFSHESVLGKEVDRPLLALKTSPTSPVSNYYLSSEFEWIPRFAVGEKIPLVGEHNQNYEGYKYLSFAGTFLGLASQIKVNMTPMTPNAIYIREYGKENDREEDKSVVEIVLDGENSTYLLQGKD